MRFWEAMKALEEGKKVRCKDWDKGHFMSFKLDNTSVLERQELWYCIDKEWQLFEEPEQLTPEQLFGNLYKNLLMN